MRHRERHTLATTDISSAQDAWSLGVACCLLALVSSSTTATLLVRPLTANCASCLAAVFLTDWVEPVSRRSKSLSKLWRDEGGGEGEGRRRLP